LKWSSAHRIPDRTKSAIGALFTKGAALFALGFIIWNLDNIFCNNLTRWKAALGWPVAFLLEGMPFLPHVLGYSWLNTHPRAFLVAHFDRKP
jgi:hypothetical protein